MEHTLTAKLREAGVVGAGGAGFPTAVKLNVGENPDSKPEFIIVNGVECESLIRVDQQLAALHAPALLATLNELVTSLGAKGGIFAIKEKYTDAFNALSAEIKKYPL